MNTQPCAIASSGAGPSYGKPSPINSCKYNHPVSFMLTKMEMELSVNGKILITLMETVMEIKKLRKTEKFKKRNR